MGCQCQTAPAKPQVVPWIDAGHEFCCMCTMVVSSSRHLQTPTKGCSHHHEVLKAILAANSPLWTGLQAPLMQVWATEPAQLGAGGCFTSMSDTRSGWNTSHFKLFCLKRKKKEVDIFFIPFSPLFHPSSFPTGHWSSLTSCFSILYSRR